MSRRIKRQEDGERKGEHDADFTCLEPPEIGTVVTDAGRSTKNGRTFLLFLEPTHHKQLLHGRREGKSCFVPLRNEHETPYRRQDIRAARVDGRDSFDLESTARK
jgi:hypothetical protein